MDPKDYHKEIETAMTYDEWKGALAPSFDDNMMTAMKRLHDYDYKERFEEMLKREYQEYLGNLNGNWLLD